MAEDTETTLSPQLVSSFLCKNYIIIVYDKPELKKFASFSKLYQSYNFLLLFYVFNIFIDINLFCVCRKYHILVHIIITRDQQSTS